jgi:hypothetical protein
MEISTHDRARTVRRWLPTTLARCAAFALIVAGTGCAPVVPAVPAASSPPAQPSVPQVPADAGNRVTFLDAATAERMRGMTITLPPWPDESLRRYCPAGRFTFVDGQAPTGGSQEPPGRGPWTYRVLYKGLRGVQTDVDGRPGEEIVFPMGCGDIENVFRLLVIQPDGPRMRAVGYVGSGLFIPGHDRYFGQDGDLVVEVNPDPLDQTGEQRRRYRWQGSRFVQVAGPTSFPPDTGIRLDELRNGSFAMYDITREPGSRDNFSVGLSFVDGVSGMWPYHSEEFSHPGAGFLLDAVSTGRLAEPDEIGRHAGDALVTLTCRWDDGGVDQFVYRVTSTGTANVVVRVGVDGVSGIVSHRIVDGLAEVTVTTATGQETRRYRSTGYVFIREG